MPTTKVTLNEIMTAVRELTFDRFIIPAFAIKAQEGYVIDIVPPAVNPNRVTRVIDGGDAGSDYTEGEPIPGDVIIDGGDAASVYADSDYDSGVDMLPGTSDPTVLTRVTADGALAVEAGGYLEIRKKDSTIKGERFYFTEYITLNDLMDAFIERGVVVAYTPYFKGDEPSISLVKVSGRSLDTDLTVFRRYFFSDIEIKEMIRWYYFRVLDIKNVELTDETIGKLIRPSERHMAIWVSYFLVDKRRVYENAASAIGQSFTDGSDYTGSATNGTPLSTTVQIGSVFSITEDATQGYFYEDFNRVGSDNVWGDRYSFWYRLMLYLRSLLEDTFGDYSLRKDNVIPGYIQLTRELDFRAYYDSYPFSLSPLSRGILSRVP